MARREIPAPRPPTKPSPRSLAIPPASLRRPLLAWYRRDARDLPWRRTRDPYAIWIAEVILQQTRVDQGLPYYERFLRQFPTVQALAAATADELLKVWEGLGYYTRARNLHLAAKRIAYERNGLFPQNRDEWIALPGVGPYTAGAIASIAFGERAAVVDGNVVRVLSRLFDIAVPIDEPPTRKKLWGIAEALVPPKSPGEFNQALMELGARICTPKAPACDRCPVARFCRARRRGVQERRPVRRAKAPTPLREMVAAAIRRDGRYLVLKRRSSGLLGGLWELPGGEVGHGEEPARALRRILIEEFGISAVIGGLVSNIRFAYSHFRVSLSVYRGDWRSGAPASDGHSEAKWVPPGAFSRLAFPKSHHKFLHLL